MNDQPYKIIGLTGPIASGKDSVAKILQKQGAAVIDADQVAHTLYNPQTPVWREIVKAFGSKILMRGGKINRQKLAKIVFSDEKKLLQLNGIVHPRLREAIIESCKLLVVSSKLIVINAAVLSEIGLVDYVDEVWVVMASKEKRLKRLLKKGSSKTSAQKRISSQMPQKEYLAMADRVIRNDGSSKSLRKAIMN